MSKANVKAQLEALRDLGWLYSQARIFYGPQRFEDTDVEGMRQLWREATKANWQASQKIEAAKKRLLATGYDVPDSWLTVRAVGRAGMSEGLLDAPKPKGKKRRGKKPQRLAVMTDPGADLEALDTVCKEIYVAAMRLAAQQGGVGKGPANLNLSLPPQPTVQRAAEYIREHPGVKASIIAKHCGIQAKSFIAHIAPGLKGMGFTSRRGCEGGYYPPGYEAQS
jgi:hypothetical protein